MRMPIGIPIGGRGYAYKDADRGANKKRKDIYKDARRMGEGYL